MADLYAFLKSLPASSTEPPAWNVAAAPDGAPRGQALMIQFGCGQCHGPEMSHPRRDIGEKMASVDYAAFARMVYEHAPPQMGLFNPERLPEPILREIWGFMKEMGFRAFLWASVTASPEGDGAVYSVTLDNKGITGKGLTAGDITVSLLVPKGFTVVGGTGEGYQGIQRDVEYVKNPGQLAPFRGMNRNPTVTRVKGDVVSWTVAEVKAGDTQTMTVTLSGTGTPDFTGSTITWTKPDIKRLATVTHTDDRLAARGDILYAPGPEFTVPPQPEPVR
jgi:hypothetical protein